MLGVKKERDGGETWMTWASIQEPVPLTFDPPNKLTLEYKVFEDSSVSELLSLLHQQTSTPFIPFRTLC